MTADLHPDTGLPRPGTCCGVCPPIAGGGWDCTCEGNIRCQTAADRPSVTDNARAEAELRYGTPDFAAPNDRTIKYAAFIEGAEWAAGRAETTDEEVAAYAEGRAEALDLIRREWCPCVDGQPQDCKPEDWPTSRRHGYPARLRDALAAGRAETTTATIKDAADVIHAHPIGPLGPNALAIVNGGGTTRVSLNEAHAIATDLAARGLLATARTRPTETEWRVRYPDGDGHRISEAVARDPWPLVEGAVVERREVTAWTEGDR